MEILIHTSVKLVTQSSPDRMRRYSILIHTSVKLVTLPPDAVADSIAILIHTSVKLVTSVCLEPVRHGGF